MTSLLRRTDLIPFRVHVPQALRTLLIVAVVLTLGAASVAAASGANYYVDSVAGSDSNNGTSEASPWKSLTPVANRAWMPGDTINLKRGSYWNFRLYLTRSGAAGNPITLKAYGTGAAPVISNTADNTINLNGSYWVIQDILVRDGYISGIEIATAAQHNVIQNTEITVSGQGIVTHGGYTLITHNYIHDLKSVVDVGAATDYGAEAITVSGGAHDTEISYNRIVNNRVPSLAFGYDGGAVEFWQNSNNTNIHHNYSSGNNGFMEAGGGTITNVTFSYNISDKDYGAFTCIHTQGQFHAPITNFKVENNTVIRTDGFGWSLLDWDNGAAPSQFFFRNNIVYANTHQVTLSSSFTRNNNLYYLYGGASMGMSLGSGEKQADPKFVNFAGGDYHLQSGSPAMDAGANLGYTLDFDSRAVPSGAGPDMGAFAFGSPAPASQAMSQPLFSAGPQSASQYRFGFKTLSDLLGGRAGSPLEEERHDPTNGDGLQQTTGGLMVWRKADNWAAFTDGNSTWINGPFGLQDRSNLAVFGWEAVQ